MGAGSARLQVHRVQAPHTQKVSQTHPSGMRRKTGQGIGKGIGEFPWAIGQQWRRLHQAGQRGHPGGHG